MIYRTFFRKWSKFVGKTSHVVAVFDIDFLFMIIHQFPGPCDGVSTMTVFSISHWSFCSTIHVFQNIFKNVYFYCNSNQKIVSEYTRIEKEFGLHIWRIYSPHEYYKTVEFQLQTPTGSGWTRKLCYSQVVRFGNKKNILIIYASY